MCFSSYLQNRARAFTLIELLVVIGIIAVLASILLPVLGTVHAQADSVKCTANLRQLGTGITSYAGDHDSRLPGPLEPLIYPAYTQNGEKDTALVKFIAPYISVATATPNNTTTLVRETVTTCPAFTRVVKIKGLPCYVLNYADKLSNANQVPWGVPGGGADPVQMAVLTAWSDTTSTATHLASASGQRDLTRTWAIKDVDVKAFANMAGIGDTGNFPPLPVHGDYRNALFYDWHVGKIDLDDNPYVPK